jgi:hypothetical protein
MRTLVLAALLAAPVVAHADPLALTATTTGEAPRTYVLTGVALGGAASHTLGALTAEVGVRVSDHFVVHAEGIGGGIASLFDGQGTYLAVTGGIDATTCGDLETVCAYAGAGVGYAASKYTSEGWFGGSQMSTGATGPVAMLRAGLDIGNKHVRWRPGFEASVVGPSAGALTNAVEFRF